MLCKALTSAATVLCLCAATLAQSEQTGAPSNQPANAPADPEAILAWAAERWTEEGWNAPSGAGGYLRGFDDKGWEVRMLAMRRLVEAGKRSVPVLLRALNDDKLPMRILAAQTLGYLAADVAPGPLLAALRVDQSAAVRLYAADSIGMQGPEKLGWMLGQARESEENGDVKRHIAYAMDRKNEGVDERIIHSLVQWDQKSIDSAKVGALAPDFELSTITGQRIRLSQFRGQQAVVLVFIYGDT